MINLLNAGLYGGNLIRIDSPVMVGRYNACLQKLGKPPTELQSFQIDGIGWSPQIAEEKGDSMYLSYTEANPCGIILTPDQRGKAIHFPFHSFDRHLMRIYFKTYGRQVSCLTSMTGLVIELDYRLSMYQDPRDLLMVDVVLVKSKTTDGIITAAKNQRHLVQRYTAADGWSDPQLRQQLIVSGEKYGDLRTKPVVIEDLPIAGIRSFYSSLFGGVYVLRDNDAHSPVLILEDHKSPFIGDDVILLRDRERVLDMLVSRGLVDVYLDRADVNWLEAILDSLVAEVFFSKHPRKDLRENDTWSWNGYLNEARKFLPSEYFEIERLMVNLEMGGAEALAVPALSQSARELLLRPKKQFEKEDPLLYDLLMQLLVSVNHASPAYVYAFNKKTFFERYARWPVNKKHWSIARILGSTIVQKQKV